MQKIRNYIKKFIIQQKTMYPSWYNITFPDWYKYLLISFFLMFIVFGLAILFQFIFRESNIIFFIGPYALIFSIFVIIAGGGTLIYIVYQVLKNEYEDYRTDKYTISKIRKGYKMGKQSKYFLNKLIVEKRKLIVSKIILEIWIILIFIFFLREYLDILIFGIPFFILIIYFDILKYKNYIKMKTKLPSNKMAIINKL